MRRVLFVVKCCLLTTIIAVSIPSLPASLWFCSKSNGYAFTSLRQHNFRLFWFGQTISLMGTSMQIIGSLPLGYLLMGWLSGLYGALLSLLVAGAG